MNDLVKKSSEPKPPVEVHSNEPVPTWRELRQRFTDLVKDIGGELRDVWSEEGNPRVLAGLKRSRDELNKLIAKLEERMAKKP
jgi:hypothetical protein